MPVCSCQTKWYYFSVFATVILNTRQSGIGNGLTYAVSADLWKGCPSPSTPLRTGSAPLLTIVGYLVKVPLRKKLIEGIVIDFHAEKPEGDYDIKEIAKVLS